MFLLVEIKILWRIGSDGRPRASADGEVNDCTALGQSTPASCSLVRTPSARGSAPSAILGSPYPGGADQDLGLSFDGDDKFIFFLVQNGCRNDERIVTALIVRVSTGSG